GKRSKPFGPGDLGELSRSRGCAQADGVLSWSHGACLCHEREMRLALDVAGAGGEGAPEKHSLGDPVAVLARIVSLRWVLSIVVTVLLVAGLLHLAAEARELAAVAGRIRWHFLPVALLLSAANVLLAALRFRLILLSLGYRLTFGTCVRAVLA